MGDIFKRERDFEIISADGEKHNLGKG